MNTKHTYELSKLGQPINNYHPKTPYTGP